MKKFNTLNDFSDLGISTNLTECTIRETTLKRGLLLTKRRYFKNCCKNQCSMELGRQHFSMDAGNVVVSLSLDTLKPLVM